MRVVTAVLVAAAAAGAVELENWRMVSPAALDELGLLVSSPSGMFWDDVAVEDSALRANGCWPDTVWRGIDHWRLEPALRGLVANTDFADGRRVAGRLELANDVRYRRLFMRQALDVDSRYKDDPSYPWKTDRIAAGRFEEAYVQLTFDHGFVRLGRTKRAWGPFADGDLLLSANAPAYDALEWQVHGSFFEFRHLLAAFPLDRSGLDTRSAERQRYLTAHALNFMIGHWVTVGACESVVFGADGVPDLQYVNPVGIYTVTNTNGESAGNLMLALQWRVLPLTERVVLKGQVLIDDIQVDNDDAGDQEPAHWGADAAVEWRDPLPLRLRHALRLRYTYLSRWLYLVSRPSTRNGESYTYLGSSLGNEENDADRWDLGVTAMSGRGWWTRLGATYGRRGGNTLATPWNTGDTAHPDAGSNGYRHETSLRSDTAEHAIGVYVEGRMGWRGYVDGGVRLETQWVKNRDNVRTSGLDFQPLVSTDVTIQYPRLYRRFGARRAARQAEGAVDDARE